MMQATAKKIPSYLTIENLKNPTLTLLPTCWSIPPPGTDPAFAQ